MTVVDPQGYPLLPPRKQTPTERLHEVTMAALNRKPAIPESAVTLSRNAKGEAQFEVVVRGEDAEACEELARRIFDELATAYPYGAGESSAVK